VKVKNQLLAGKLARSRQIK